MSADTKMTGFKRPFTDTELLDWLEANADWDGWLGSVTKSPTTQWAL